MEDKMLVIPASGGLIDGAQAPISVAQTGEKNILVGNANNVNNTINVFLPFYAQQSQPLMAGGVSLCKDYYNLFVIGGETVETDHFRIDLDRALTESMEPQLKEKYSHLSAEAIEEIKKFPAIVATENHQYGRTDPDHNVVFALVKDIKVQENGVRIEIIPLQTIQQQVFNEHADDFALGRASRFNELNRMHWSIKRIDIIQALKDNGIGTYFTSI